jgi:hypothetical protein
VKPTLAGQLVWPALVVLVATAVSQALSRSNEGLKSARIW